MNRKALSLSLALVLTFSLVMQPKPTPGEVVPDAPVAEVVGTGFFEAIACAACVAGAGAIVAGGPGAVLVAIHAPHSFWVAAACVGACAAAFD